MAYGHVRRRISEFFRRDWLEIFAAAFGILLLAVGVAAVYGIVYLIATYNNHKLFQDFSATSQRSLSIGGMIILAALAAASLAGGWGLVGKRVARSLAHRRDRTRDEAPAEEDSGPKRLLSG